VSEFTIGSILPELVSELKIEEEKKKEEKEREIKKKVLPSRLEFSLVLLRRANRCFAW